MHPSIFQSNCIEEAIRIFNAKVAAVAEPKA